MLITWTPVYLDDRIRAGTRHPEKCWVTLSDRRPYTICLTVAGYHLPTVLMIFCYIRVYKVVRRDQRTVACENETGNQRVDAVYSIANGDFKSKISCEQLGTVPTSVAQRNGARRQKKVFLTLSYVVLAYLVLWTPSQIVVDIMCFDNSLVSIDLYYYVSALCYFNSALNPVLYAASSVQTRQAFRKVLCWYRR